LWPWKRNIQRIYCLWVSHRAFFFLCIKICSLWHFFSIGQ
jgi:hypothetical protein